MDQDGVVATNRAWEGVHAGTLKFLEVALPCYLVRKPRLVRASRRVSHFSKLKGSGAIGCPAHGNKKDPNIQRGRSDDQEHMHQ